MKPNAFIKSIGLAVLTACSPHPDERLLTPVSDPVPVMRTSFMNPPDEARIRAYWWWLNGNVTKKSITRDLEEMKSKGFGGAVLFDAGSSNYSVAKKTKHGPDFGSAEWTDLLRHSVREGDRFGLELSLNIQSGWNPGGPSVIPADAMKKLTFSEITVTGPRKYQDTLPHPDSLLFYQDVVVQAVPALPNNSDRGIYNFAFKSLNQALGWKGIYPLEKLRDPGPDSLPQEGILMDLVIDLSKNYQYGILTWNIPKGNWTIIRYGMTCTGARVSTSSDGWSGLSFDHLSQKAFRKYFSEVVDPLVKAAKEAGKSLKYLYTDSWEMGVANWTEDFIGQFKRFRSYDPTPWLPVLTNRVVGSRTESDRFLKDFRKTVGDCIAENHYALFRDLAQERGLGIHPESGGPHSVPADALKNLGRNDFPMGEYWARSNTHRITEAERLAVKQSACAAHTYGKRFVAAEGPTSIGPQWERSPRDVKNVIDQVFCSGVNRLVWHTFTNSPAEEGIPGSEYFAGTHFNPNVTWWPAAGAFVSYLNRCSYMLSQGLFVADVLYYYGDDVPNFVFLREEEPDFPEGYHWDKCNLEVLLNRLKVKNGRIALPDGMEYRVLVVRDWDNIDKEAMRKIRDLVSLGAMVLKIKAQGSRIKDQVSIRDQGSRIKEEFGKGCFFEGYTVAEVLQELQVPADLLVQSAREDTRLDFIHRSTPDADIYFVVNKWAWDSIHDYTYRYIPETPDRFDAVELTFRAGKGVPEFWDPMTGKSYQIKELRKKDGKVTIPMTFGPEESRFIVISRRSSPEDSSLPVLRGQSETKSISDIIETGITGFQGAGYVDLSKARWTIRFDPEWGPREPVFIDELKSWTTFDDPQIRYYSGSAVYTTTFSIPELLPYLQYKIDLGNVQELCRIRVNGTDAGYFWFPPFIADITTCLKKNENILEITVYNLWPNRLIGDSKLPPGQRRTQTNITKFDGPDADKYLRVSGLLGPVKIAMMR